jgi:hypothetical protein
VVDAFHHTFSEWREIWTEDGKRIVVIASRKGSGPSKQGADKNGN